MIVILMGVCGCGKSSVGLALSSELGCPFIDADSLHPDTNKAKMAQGTPLTDDDRMPWLEAVSKEASRAVSNGGSTGTVVVACSALKLHYRDVLRGGCHRYSTGGEASPASANLTLLDHREGGMRHQDSLNTTAGVLFVHLDGSFELIQSRMSKREDHFMPTSLLVSQFDTLEPPATPEEFLRVDISADVLDIVKIITASVSF